MGTVTAFDVRVSRVATLEDVGRERALAMAPPPRPWRMAVLVLVGLTLMTSAYTFAVGLAAVVLILLVGVMPRSLRWSASRSWASNEHLQGEQLHAIDPCFIRFESERFRARCPWSNLYRWSLQDGRLHLFCRGMPAVVIPEDALVEARCLEAVLALAPNRPRRAALELGQPRDVGARRWAAVPALPRHAARARARGRARRGWLLGRGPAAGLLLGRRPRVTRGAPLQRRACGASFRRAVPRRGGGAPRAPIGSRADPARVAQPRQAGRPLGHHRPRRRAGRADLRAHRWIDPKSGILVVQR